MDKLEDRWQYSHNGYTYVCKFAPARTATRMGFRLASVIAPVIQGLSKLKKVEGAFSAAMIYLFTNPALEETVVALADAFAPYTEVIVDGSSPPVSYTLGGIGVKGPWIDVHFAGKQDAMLEWLGHVTEQNCASFLAGLLAKSKEAEKALAALRGTSSASPSDAGKTG